MTKITPTSSPPASPATRHAKGAARETIGKLIGDDAAVRKGREEQRRARAEDAPAGDTDQQEQE
ncbi:hypothetical protein [uncultured Sphingomonas sp.]|uniref:hypothetical protein n=1 Tax=uncultured Sphingomonas sp. TaxID=158754 RepID=UPI0025DB66A9|nr:hypothetical protein [uncultured Sphingomonas sp.]